MPLAAVVAYAAALVLLVPLACLEDCKDTPAHRALTAYLLPLSAEGRCSLDPPIKGFHIVEDLSAHFLLADEDLLRQPSNKIPAGLPNLVDGNQQPILDQEPEEIRPQTTSLFRGPLGY